MRGTDILLSWVTVRETGKVKATLLWYISGGGKRERWRGMMCMTRNSLTALTPQEACSGTFYGCILCFRFHRNLKEVACDTVLRTWIIRFLKMSDRRAGGGQGCCCTPAHVAAHYPLPSLQLRDNPEATSLFPTWHETETKYPCSSLLSPHHNSEKKRVIVSTLQMRRLWFRQAY